ncbi:MAG: hypothetical protein LBJ64_11995 [Deltaproteobacteria bacterium]|nr:hypothetical protein [Deltaproteobacteria bacterium]
MVRRHVRLPKKRPFVNHRRNPAQPKTSFRLIVSRKFVSQKIASRQFVHSRIVSI